MPNDANMNLRVRDGITACTNNDGVEVIYKIPRSNLVKCKDITELKHGGIFLLFGERDGRQIVYVGQTVKNLFGQLNELDRSIDKNFFTEAIVFTTKDNSFGAREIVWLEDKFFDELKSAGRLVFKIDDDKQTADFEVHAEFARTALDTIGYKIFEPSPVTELDEEIFYLKQYINRLGQKIHAQMKRTPTGYRVLADSEISRVGDVKLSRDVKNARRLAKIDCGLLLEDVDFSKPSTAAEFVLGQSANGYELWCTKDGVTLGKILGR